MSWMHRSIFSLMIPYKKGCFKEKYAVKYVFMEKIKKRMTLNLFFKYNNYLSGDLQDNDKAVFL